jgi:peptidoglycan/LPS O-acetylase OafA/YrhL
MHRAQSPYLKNVLRQLVLFFHHQPPHTPARKERYPNFDLFRLLLAVEVAFVHMWAEIDPNFGWPGYVMAVPAFLAISGFLVLQSYSESGCWRVFITKRILRIIPALLVSFVLCLILFGPDMVKESFFVWISGGALPLIWSSKWSTLVISMGRIGLSWFGNSLVPWCLQTTVLDMDSLDPINWSGLV